MWHCTLCPQKTITLDNVRYKCQSERILTKLCVLGHEYICDRIAKFHKKILFITQVINIQILMTKYFSFQYSVTYCSQAVRRPAHRARKTVHLLTHETPDFITPALWPAYSPDLNPVDYQIWGNFIKIRHCLPELWQHVHGYSVFVDTVYLYNVQLHSR